MKATVRPLTLWVPVAAWMGVIFLLSSVPGKQIPRVPLPQFHKLVHFAEYSALGCLMLRALLATRLDEKRVVTLCLLIVLAFALSDEGHQRFVPGRSPFAGDVAADMLFAIAGITGYIMLRSFMVSGRREGIPGRPRQPAW
jgi:VanZ family protein